MALTKEQFNELRAKGLTTQQIISFDKGDTPETLREQATRATEGFGRKLFRGITEPVVTLAARPFQLAKAIGGASVKEQEVKLPFYGTIKAPTSTKDVVKDIGRGIETVSLGVGGGGLKTTVQTGLKGLVKEGAIQGFKTGVTTGGMTSFGQAIQEADVQASDVAYKTLFGAATGAVTGLAIGAATPIVVKGVQGVQRFANINELNKKLTELNTTTLKPTPKQVQNWTDQGVDPIQTYSEIFATKVPQVDKSNRFIKESVDEFVDQVDQVYKPSAEGFNTILRNSPEVNSLKAMEQDAIANLKKYSGLEPESLTIAENKISQKFNSIRAEAQKKGMMLGDDNIPVAYSDNLKDRYWGATKNFGTEEAGISNQVNRSIGNAFKDGIETVIDDVNVRNYNKQLQKYIVLKDFLGGLSGKLAGDGGKMTRLFSRAIGSVAGSGGGPVGSITGAITGDELARIWINPNNSPMRWLILKQLQKLPQAERQSLEQQANEVIQQMFQKRADTLRLPAPSFIPVGAKTPNPSSVVSVPAQKGLVGQDPKSGKFFGTYKSTP